MFLVAAVLLLVTASVAYLRFGWCALDPVPWRLYAAMLLASALGVASLKTATNRALRLAALLPVAGGLLFVAAHAWFTDYGDARPEGPDVGRGFPRTTRVDALGKQAVPVGVAPPGKRGQLIVFFRGFW